MNDIEILNQIDNIYGALNRMKKAPHGTLGFSITYIEYELDALRERVENAFHDKDVVIADLRKAIEIYKEAH